MKILISGGCEKPNYEEIALALDRLQRREKQECLETKRPFELTLILGGPHLTDALAQRWAFLGGIPVLRIETNSWFYGRAAESVRASWLMKTTVPDVVLSIPGDEVAPIITLAQAYNIPVVTI